MAISTSAEPMTPAAERMGTDNAWFSNVTSSEPMTPAAERMGTVSASWTTPCTRANDARSGADGNTSQHADHASLEPMTPAAERMGTDRRNAYQLFSEPMTPAAERMGTATDHLVQSTRGANDARSGADGNGNRRSPNLRSPIPQKPATGANRSVPHLVTILRTRFQ